MGFSEWDFFSSNFEPTQKLRVIIEILASLSLEMIILK